jgi:GPH family glycoside/pentoside/hexuronide:cation symporter
MYADIADYSEWKTGRRATGLIFSSSSMSQKMGWTLGGAVTGWLLASYGFEANAEQSAESLKGIRLMLSVYPAFGAVLSAAFLTIYKLNDSYMSLINKELSKRRSNSPAESK